MLYDIRITVDENDADYNTLCSVISGEDLEKIKPLIEAIKRFKEYEGKSKDGMKFIHRHNYPIQWRDDLGELSPRDIYLNDDDVFDLFEEHCPACGEWGFHTIISIEIAPTREMTKLL
jgi:hypothetical protein